jgi:hypothetical protein
VVGAALALLPAVGRAHQPGLSRGTGIHVVPTGNGIEVVVRYITRAHERHEARRRLYEAVLELMHGKRGAGAQASQATAG